MKKLSRRPLHALLVLAVLLFAMPALAADGQQGVVNINSASSPELELLPGVGPSLAGRIVTHRDANGAFKSIDDLLLVRGIGEKSLERIRPYIALSGATTLKERVPSPRPKTGRAKKNLN